MAVVTKNIQVKTKKGVDLVDITSRIVEAVEESNLKNGTVTVFVTGSTGAISTVEYEPGLIRDIPKILERIAPSDISYEHNKTWGCDNGVSHARATIIGPSLTIPFVNKKLTLGTWQQIVFIELDTRPRERDIVLQIMGE